MEELRTIEILDLEIMEDARGKASKILKAADDILKNKKLERAKKLEEALVSARKDYAERTKRIHEEIFTRFPLDKRRLRVEFAEDTLLKKTDDFLRALPREKLLFILEQKLSGCFKACTGNKNDLDGAELLYSGMELSEARELVKKAMNTPGPEPMKFREDPVNHEFPSIVINTRSIRIIASVEAAAANLLKEKRAELAEALLGEGVLND